MHLSKFLPKFTVRRLMVAVGILMGIVGWMMRRITMIDRCWEFHALSGLTEEQDGFGHPRSKLTDYHRALAQKYRHAARYPWLPVAPDPPEPD